MQPADHVDFGDPKGQRVPDSADNFINRIFERVRIALFRRERTELAGKDADVGVIDVTIVDVRRVVAVFSLAQNAGDHSQRVQVIRAIKRNSIGIGDSLTCFNLFGDGLEVFRDDLVIHAHTEDKSLTKHAQAASGLQQKPWNQWNREFEVSVPYGVVLLSSPNALKSLGTGRAHKPYSDCLVQRSRNQRTLLMTTKDSAQFSQCPPDATV